MNIIHFKIVQCRLREEIFFLLVLFILLLYYALGCLTVEVKTDLSQQQPHSL